MASDVNSAYLHNFRQIANRLKWDLNYKSWVSRRRLKYLHNKYAGSKAVILCNGPSLLKSDLSCLDGVYTFGLNKINLLFDRSTFRPSCVVAVNSLVMEQNLEFFNDTNLPLFLDSRSSHYINDRKNLIFLHSSPQVRFARNCSASIFNGYTVTFVALQLAYHMGFKNVALIGCDHDFVVKGPANKEVVSGDEDNSHFDPRYFAGGVKWNLPDLLQSEVSYNLAKEAYASTDRKIFNATVDGKLEIFERITLEEFCSISPG